ncbi:MAG: glycosyltransferase family 4 protein [Colwellia sp.]
MNHYAQGINHPQEGRSFFLAESINRLKDCKCTVIASSFHHFNRNQQEQAPKILTKNIDGVSIIWLKTPEYLGNGLKRIRNMFSYSYQCWVHDFSKLDGIEVPDVIIVSSVHPFHFLSALKWSKIYGAKLVFEVRDLWPLSLNLLLGVSKYHPFSLLLSAIERIAYRKSDLVISVLSNALSYMEPKGVNQENFLYLPNGYSTVTINDTYNEHEEALKKIRNKYKRIVMHTGSMGTPNGLELLVTISNKLKDNDKIAFIFIGNGDKKDELIRASNSPHSYFFPPIPKSQLSSALKYADICYCGSQKYLQDLYCYGVSPNKIFDYMAASKFVLFVVDSIDTPIELAKAGVKFSPSSEDDIHDFLVSSLQLEDSFFSEKGNSGKEYLIENHYFEGLSNKLIEKLKNI